MDEIETARHELREAALTRPLDRDRLLAAITEYSRVVGEPVPPSAANAADYNDEQLAGLAAGIVVGLSSLMPGAMN
jgi:hypothetical protein